MRVAAGTATVLFAVAAVTFAHAALPLKGYPAKLPHSCWARDSAGGPIQLAPSVFPKPPRVTRSPEQLVRRVLARFDDDRFVQRVEIGKPPPLTRQHRGYFGDSRPPRDALWAYIAARPLSEPSGPESEATSKQMLRDWELELMQGALRDEFCAAGGRPLAGWSTGGTVAGVSDRPFPFLLRFASPSETILRRRIAAAGAQYGFRLVSLRMLRPFQSAPMVVVETDRDRDEFVGDVSAIVRALDPTATVGGVSGPSYEGFFFEARDADGAFVRVESALRGLQMGGQWSAGLVYPNVHG